MRQKEKEGRKEVRKKEIRGKVIFTAFSKNLYLAILLTQKVITKKMFHE